MLSTYQLIPTTEITTFFPQIQSFIPKLESKSILGFCIFGRLPQRDSETVAALFSRLPKCTSPDAPWLSAVKRFIAEMPKETIIVSSTGLLGWDYISWYAARQDRTLLVVTMPQILSSANNLYEQIRINLNLVADKTTILIPILEKSIPKAEGMQLRDKLILALTNTAYPILLRPGSTWEDHLSDENIVNRTFQVKFTKGERPPWINLMKNEKIAYFNNKGFLFHWTKGVYGPWTGENQADYFSALTAASLNSHDMNNRNSNPRDGFATLKQIGKNGILRGEGRMVRQGVPVVSFTGRSVQETLKNVRYRSSLGRYNYEPYGIGIKLERLEKLGVRQVIYGSSETFEALNDSQKPYFQLTRSISKTRTQSWIEEKEFRLTGDLDIGSLDSKEKIFVVPFLREAIEMRKITNCKVIVLQNP